MPRTIPRTTDMRRFPRARRALRAVTLLLSALCFVAGTPIPRDGTAGQPPFVSLRLPHGILIDAPRNWQVLDEETRELIAASLDDALDLSGLSLRDRQIKEDDPMAAEAMTAEQVAGYADDPIGAPVTSWSRGPTAPAGSAGPGPAPSRPG